MKALALAVFLIFTFQAFDVPPVRSAVNPKTCCGRKICLCKHAKGASCPFHLKTLKEQKAVKSQPAAQGHCHRHKTAPAQEKKESVQPEKTARALGLTKAPCASHTPKTVLVQYSKDYIFPSAGEKVFLPAQLFIPSDFLQPVPLQNGTGLERPPRIF